MTSLEYFLIALTLGFVTQWVLQQHHKFKYGNDKPFSLMELGILVFVYLAGVYIVDSGSGSGPKGGGIGVEAPVEPGPVVVAAAVPKRVLVPPQSHLRYIHEKILTGLPPF